MYFDSENVLENKLIILYALQHFKTPLTKEQITQIILENVQISYFDVQFLVENLKTDGFIDEIIDNNNFYYNLSENGKKTLKLFENRIPPYIKEMISLFISQNRDRILKQVKYMSSYKKLNDEEFVVNLQLVENEVTLIEIKLNVVNKTQAEFVSRNWEKNGEQLYSKVIGALIEEYQK